MKERFLKEQDLQDILFLQNCNNSCHWCDWLCVTNKFWPSGTVGIHEDCSSGT